MDLNLASIETAAPKGAWFTSMSKEAQKAYLARHPSRKAAGTPRKQAHANYALWHMKKALEHTGHSMRADRSAALTAGNDKRQKESSAHANKARYHRHLSDQHQIRASVHMSHSGVPWSKEVVSHLDAANIAGRRADSHSLDLTFADTPRERALTKGQLQIDHDKHAEHGQKALSTLRSDIQKHFAKSK